MKRKAALIVVAVLLLGLAAWSQEHPKAEIAVDYSYVHYGAIDYTSPGFDFARAYSLNGGGGSAVFNFTRMFGFKAEFQGYGSDTKSVTVPPGNPYFPAGGSANVSGNLFTYMFGPQIGKRYGVFRPYGQVLFGGAHTNAYGNAWNNLNFTQVSKAPSNNAFALDVGAGLDIAVSRRFSIRPFELSWLRTGFNNKLSNNQENFRYLGGVVFNLGGAEPVPPAASCSVSPSELLPWEGPATATVQPTGFNPKHTLAYAWTSTAGTLTGDGTTKIDTASLSPGTYTVNSSVSDPKKKKLAPASCSATFTVKSPRAPVITCTADPSTVQPGQSVTLTAQGVSPDHQQLKDRTFSTSAGSVRESQTSAGTEPGSFVSTATLDTTGVAPGTVNVTLNVTDVHGLTGSCVASVNVQAPPAPAPPPAPKSSKLSQCDFPNNVKPWRVDNTCKALLDDVALRLQQEADAKLVIVGNADPTEKRKNLAAERAVNSKTYLSGGEAKQAIDPSRIETRTGNAGTKTAEYWVVPAGATFDSTGTESVDETMVKAVPDHPHAIAPKAQ